MKIIKSKVKVTLTFYKKKYKRGISNTFSVSCFHSLTCHVTPNLSPSPTSQIPKNFPIRYFSRHWQINANCVSLQPKAHHQLDSFAGSNCSPWPRDIFPSTVNILLSRPWLLNLFHGPILVTRRVVDEHHRRHRNKDQSSA